MGNTIQTSSYAGWMSSACGLSVSRPSRRTQSNRSGLVMGFQTDCSLVEIPIQYKYRSEFGCIDRTDGRREHPEASSPSCATVRIMDQRPAVCPGPICPYDGGKLFNHLFQHQRYYLPALSDQSFEHATMNMLTTMDPCTRTAWASRRFLCIFSP